MQYYPESECSTIQPGTASNQHFLHCRTYCLSFIYYHLLPSQFIYLLIFSMTDTNEYLHPKHRGWWVGINLISADTCILYDSDLELVFRLGSQTGLVLCFAGTAVSVTALAPFLGKQHSRLAVHIMSSGQYYQISFLSVLLALLALGHCHKVLP